MELSKTDLRLIEQKAEPVLRDVGKYIIDNWYKAHTYSYKDKRDLATEVDIKAEHILRSRLQAILPSAGFIVEEGSSAKIDGFNWVIDPLDGTKYFVKHVPMFFTQMALVMDDSPVLGQIYNPSSSQLFSASKGNGTKMNGIIFSSKTEETKDRAIINIDYGGFEHGDVEWKASAIKEFIKNFYRVKLTSGFLSIYLVTGGIDAYIVLNESIKVHDLMPRKIIFEEAGLSTRTLGFNNSAVHITSNETLIDVIEKILKNIP